MTEQSRPSSASQASGPKETAAQNATLQSATAANAVAGPLTVRDLVVLGSVLIIFVASLVPIVKTLAGSLNLWNTSGLFYIGIGVVLPLVVGGLFLARRMSPATKVRIGSLSIDQFGSVVAAFATYFFFVGTVSNFGIAFLIGLIGSLLLLVSTVCAQWIPAFAADFTGRVEVPAALAARDAVPAVKRPGAPKPVVAQMGTAQQNAGQQPLSQQPLGQGAPVPGAPAQYVPGQQGVAQQGGWNSAPATPKHNQAGQIFTPAKENSAGAGAGAGFGAGSAAAGSAGATTPAATSSAAAATPSTGAAATAGTGASAGTPGAAAPATAASAESGSARSTPAGDHSAATHTAAQPSVQTPAAAQGNFGATGAPSAKETEAKEVVATTLNPQVPEALKSEAVKPAAAAENPFAPSANRESITATVNPSVAPVVAEPFWFAVDRPQNAIDEKTRQFAFKLVPGVWILALEDRGNSFLVQDSRGKTGLLLDLVGIERASDSQ